MSNRRAISMSAGVAAVVLLGVGAWYVSRQEDKGELLDKLGDVADQTREKAGGVARALREKATPLMRTVGEMVEKNADLVSALANVDADQVRRTGQEIREAAATLDKNLEGLANI
jgi:hypothetical protein